MKVLKQMIEHFWERGALSLDEAHYLVEHGFVGAWDLPGYAPLSQDDEELHATGASDYGPSEPDPLEMEHERLVSRPSSGRGRGPKVAEYAPAELQADLARLLDQRTRCFSALIEMTQGKAGNHQAAAVRLRQYNAAAFSKLFIDSVRKRPSLLADVWEAVSDQAFHVLLERPNVRGKAARAFRRLLQTSDPKHWSGAGWLLKFDEVQTIVNLLAVRRLLLPAIVDLYEKHWAVLAKCMQRPAKPGPAWESLAFGLVLLHHARFFATNRHPSGYTMTRFVDSESWNNAWTTALALDVANVTPFMARIFNLACYKESTAGPQFTIFVDAALDVPFDWKV